MKWPRAKGAALLGLAVAVAVNLPAEAAEPTTVIRLEAAASSTEPVAAFLRWIPDEGESQGWEVVVPGEVEVATPGAGILVLEAGGFWAAPVRPSSPPGTTVVLGLRPASRLQGQVRVPKGYALPATVDVRLQTSRRPAQGATRPEGLDVSCPLQPRGEIDCVVPAGVFDVRVKAAGFAATYHWGVELKWNETVRLASRSLQPGASIVGWLEVEGGAPVGPSARASVEHVAKAAEITGDISGLRELRKEATVGLDGFFQLTGLEEGTYWLTGAQDGLAPATAIAVEAFEGLETIMRDPVLLRPAIALELQLDPPQDPQGGAWRVRLAPVNERLSERKREGEVDTAGFWRQEGLPRGEFELEILSERGDRWHEERLDLVERLESRWLGLHGVVVAGQVVLRDDPVEAHLWFGGKSGSPRVYRYADEEGKFRGLLPKGGEWDVWVELVDFPGSGLSIEPVKVQRGEELEIRLPGGRITGLVVDESGEPVAGVDLKASFGGRQLAAAEIKSRSRQDGSFDFPAVQTGRVLVTPEHPTLLGETVELDMGEESTAEGVMVEVYDPSWIEGLVVGAYGPVPGAEVVAIPELTLGEIFVGGNAKQRTSADGRFRFSVPRGTQKMTVSVFAPGYAARTLSVAPGTSEIEIQMSREGGVLDLELEGGSSEEGEYKTLLIADRHLPPALFHYLWGRPQGGSDDFPERLVLPMMEPGEYSLCSRMKGSPPGAHSCVSGMLEAGGTLSLKAP